MEFGPDWLANLFLFIFLFGLLFTVVSLLLGFGHVVGIHGAGSGGHVPHVDVGGHHIGDIGHHGDVHLGQHGADSDGPSLLNMPTLMAFLTWFGGIGYILRHSLGFGGGLAVTVAILSGAAGGGVMFYLLARWLWPLMSKPLSSTDYSLPGTPARVVSSIREGGVGEIVYMKDGTRFTAGARSDDGSPIAKGTQVVILRYDKGIAYVRDVNSIFNEDLSRPLAEKQAEIN